MSRWRLPAERRRWVAGAGSREPRGDRPVPAGEEGRSLESGEREKRGAPGVPDPEMGAWRGGTPAAGSGVSLEKGEPREGMSLGRGNPWDTKEGTPETGDPRHPEAESQGRRDPWDPKTLGIP